MHFVPSSHREQYLVVPATHLSVIPSTVWLSSLPTDRQALESGENATAAVAQHTTAAADTDTIGLILLPTSLAGGGGLMKVDGKLELRAVRSSLKLEAVEGRTIPILRYDGSMQANPALRQAKLQVNLPNYQIMLPSPAAP